ncbi:MAG: M28 family peptidase [Actinomycetota bacterium]|nr:M28 family peptidase [Actinomycetota bacterium]
MDRIRRASVLLVALVLAMTVAVAPSLALSAPAGADAYAYIEQLAVMSRVAGAASELGAAGMIEGWFQDAGYSTGMQPFTYVRHGKTRYSQNVVAYLPATDGDPDAPLVIVGAHYDSAVAGNGADDNGSGVGCMVEIAEEVASYERDYDIVFVAFGAEEVGLEGSFYYVSQMSSADRDRTIAMINFDSLIVGDKLYIHAGFNNKTGPRDAMLEIIDDLGLPIEVQPGLNEHYPTGLTPDWFSDYTAFNRAGIPIVAFESTNWEIGDLDGYVETEKYGSFWHTGKDKLKTIEQRYPGRPMARLAAYTTLVETYLDELGP